jgi:hypothetical protein
MRRETSLIILGIITIITPFLGLPWAWKTYIFVVLGLLIACISFFLRYSARLRMLKHGRKSDTFEENGYAQFEEKTTTE